MRIIHGRPEGVGTEQRGATFTGTVWADPVLPATDGVSLNNVFFTPGARTFWHSHENGQILRVASGSGLICPRDGEIEELNAGDTVWAPPGEVHWHGATPTTAMLHLAISLGEATWLAEVSEADYRR
jgi:quercetin dioxygenase-like cupin family protein